MKRRDTEDLLNVDANTFGRAVRAGQSPAPEEGTYDRTAVLDRASELISGSEILARWRRGGRGMPGPMKGKGAPTRVGHLGWKRLHAEAALASEPPSFATPRVRRA